MNIEDIIKGKIIKIDELRPILSMLNENKITYGKACDLISEICKKQIQGKIDLIDETSTKAKN